MSGMTDAMDAARAQLDLVDGGTWKTTDLANALRALYEAARLRGEGEHSDAVRALPAQWRRTGNPMGCACAAELEAALSTQPAPSEQVAASVAAPEEMTLFDVPALPSDWGSRSGYKSGWNDCRSAMIAAAPQAPQQADTETSPKKEP